MCREQKREHASDFSMLLTAAKTITDVCCNPDAFQNLGSMTTNGTAMTARDNRMAKMVFFRFDFAMSFDGEKLCCATNRTAGSTISNPIVG